MRLPSKPIELGLTWWLALTWCLALTGWPVLPRRPVLTVLPDLTGILGLPEGAPMPPFPRLGDSTGVALIH